MQFVDEHAQPSEVDGLDAALSAQHAIRLAHHNAFVCRREEKRRALDGVDELGDDAVVHGVSLMK